MNKQIRKILALTLALAMVVTSMTFVGSNNLKAAEEETANQVEQTTDQATEPAAETPEVSDPVTSEETLDVTEETPDEEGTDQEKTDEEKVTEETPVEEAAPTVNMPAQTLSATASDGAKVIVDAKEGVLPEGSSVKVKVVSAASVADAVEAVAGDVNSMAAYDITIHDKDGKEIQPEGNVSVQIQNADIEGSAEGVFHVNDAKTSAEPVGASTSGDDATFKADHFSIYVVVDGTPKLATYKFYNADGSKVIDTQIIKSGGKLTEPAVQDKDGGKFTGWKTASGASVSFGTAITVTKTQEINVYPQFAEARYVFFMDGTGDDASVLKTIEATAGQTIKSDDVKFYPTKNSSVAGWYKNPGLSGSPVGTFVMGEEDVVLYPNIQTGHWLTFNSKGGSTVDSQFLASNETTKAPTTTPTKPGYTFNYWAYENGTKFTFGSKITTDTTLYAVWKAGTANYTVIYWVENPNATNTSQGRANMDTDMYTHISSQTKSGTVGTKTNVSITSSQMRSIDFKGEKYQGFELPTSIEQQEIKGDGSTIVNVYITRKTYTLYFYDEYDKVYPVTSKDKDGKVRRITAKYNANISALWPKNRFGNTEWWVADSTWQLNIQVMPCIDNLSSGEHQKYYEPSSGSKLRKAEYYTQKLDGAYELHHTDQGTKGSSVSSEDRYPIPGFTLNKNKSTSTGSAYNGAKFYYDRNSYNVVLVNGDTQTKISKKYQENLTSLATDTRVTKPTRPAGVPSYMVFDGWYLDSNGLSSKYSFENKLMPYKDIVVYAKWVPATFKCDVYSTMEGGSKTTISGIAYGTLVTEPEKPTIPAGYTWVGWSTKSGDGEYTPYNFNEPVTKNISLYPYYITTERHTVSYDKGGQVLTSTPTDTTKYVVGSYAKVKSVGFFSESNFQGWKSSVDGKIYQAGDKIKIGHEDVVLTAQWKNAAAKTSITYKAGEGATGADYTVSNIVNNGKVQLLTASDCGFAKDGYEFTGWKTAGGTSYAAGASVNVDTLNEGTANVLIAQWNQVKVNVTYIDNNNSGTKTVHTDNIAKNESYTLYNYVKEAKDSGNRPTVTYGWTTDASLAKTNYSNKNQLDSLVNSGKFWTMGQTLSKGLSADTTYYAVWVRKSLLENFSVTFNAEGNGSLEGTTSFTNIKGGSTWQEAGVTAPTPKANQGYAFDGWYVGETKVSLPSGSHEIESNEVYTAKFKAATDTKYHVEYYYQKDDESGYDRDDNLTKERTGTTGTTASVTAADKVAKSDNYVFDSTISGTKLSGNIAANGSLVLKVYFKMRAASDVFYLQGSNVSEEYDGQPHAAGTAVVCKKGTTTATTRTTTIQYSADGTAWVDSLTATNVSDSKTVNVRAKVSGYSGYVTTTETLTIRRKAVTVTPDNKSMTYGGEVPPFTATVSGTVGTDTVSYNLGREQGDNDNVGTHNIVAYNTQGTTADENQDNYKVSFKKGTLTINKSGKFTVSGTNYDAPYDGQSHGAAADPSVTAGTTVYYKVGNGDWTTVVPTIKNVGNKEVSVKAENDNYTTATTSYTLNVSHKEVTVKADDNTKVYGTNDPTLTATVTGVVAGETVPYRVVRLPGNDVKAEGYTIKVGHPTKEGSVVEDGNYKITYVAGLFTITKSDNLTISVENNGYNGVYDGRSHKGKVNVSVTSGTELWYSVDNGAETKTAPSIKDVGSKSVTVKAVNPNYNEKSASYTLKVTPKAVTVVADAVSKSYDGKTGTDPRLTASVNGLVDDYDLQYSLSRAAGQDADSYAISVEAATTQGNYTVSTTGSTFTINPRTVTLTSATASKTYDGTPLTNSTVVIGGEGWADGEGATYNVTGSRTIVGSNANAFTYTLNSNTKVGNYTITKNEGTLTVTTRDAKYQISVEANSASVKYDGQTKSLTGFKNLTFTPEGAGGETYTVSGLTASTSTEETIKNAGTYTVGITGEPVVKDSKGNDVTKEFAVNTVPGTLTINPRNVTLTSGSASAMFNGDTLTNHDVTVSGEGFAGEEGVAGYSFSAEQTIVGSCDNEFTYTLKDNTLAANYNITPKYGKLEITSRNPKYQLTIEANSKSVKYDGGDQTVSGFTVNGASSSTFVCDGHTYHVEGIEAGVTGKDAGYYTAGFDGSVVITTGWLANKHNVTGQFDITMKTGTLHVTKRSVTMTSDSDSKTYDGTALEKKHVTETGDGFVFGQGVTYNVTGSQTAKGSSNNTFTYTANEGTNLNNYNIIKYLGTLTVNSSNALTLNISDANPTYMYDGDSHGITVTASGDDGKSTISYSIDNGANYSTNAPALTNVGDLLVKVKGENPNYDTAYGQYTIHVTKRSLTLTSGSASRAYTGAPLTKNEVNVGGNGFAKNEGATYDVTGTQTNVGSSSNTFTYELNNGTLRDNYTIHKVEGTLEVTNGTDLELDLSKAGGEFEYNAKAHGGVATANKPGTTIKYSTDNGANWSTDAPTRTNVGTTTVKVEATNSNYNTATGEYTIKVTPKAVSVTADRKEKVYGTSDPDLTATVSGTLGEDTVSYDLERESGSDVGKYTITPSGDAEQGNYAVTYHTGEFEITKSNNLELNVNAAKYDGYYDGETHGGAVTTTASGTTTITYSYSTDNKATWTDWTDEAPTQKVVGSVYVKVHAVNSNYLDKDAEYSIIVRPRPVTLKSANLSKEYDGKPLTNGNRDLVTNDGWVGNEGLASTTFSGEQTVVGTSNNAFTYTLKSNTDASNYAISKVEGALSVTDRESKYELSVQAVSDSTTYNGQEQTLTGLVATEFTVNGSTYKVKGLSAAAAGTDAGSYTCAVTGTAKVEDAEGHDVTGQFTVKSLNGTLTINKARVTLKSADLSKVYDGDPLVNGNEKLEKETGWVEGEGATYTFTGSQKRPGISDNAFFYTLKTGTKESNYIISKTEGTLSVVSGEDLEQITITANSDTATYDGQEHNVEGLTGTTFVSKNGHTYRVEGLTASGAYGTNAGTYTNKVEGTAVVYDEDNQVVTDEFNVVGVNGTLLINRATVNLKSADISRAYNGKVLTNGDRSLETESGWAEGEGATYTFTGRQTLVGYCVNEFNVSLNSNTFAENYIINKNYGLLTVTGRTEEVTFTVEANSAEYTYDGDVHRVEGFKTLTFTDNDETFRVVGLETSNPSGKDAGTYNNTISGTAKVLDKDDNDVTKQFNVETVNGVLLIKPSDELELDTSGASYVGPYDGTTHGGAVTANVDGVTIKYSTNGGSSWTTEAPTLKDTGLKDVIVKAEDPAGNYQSVQTSYVINVYPRAVTLRSADISKVYDGTALENGDTPLAMESGWVDGEGATYKFTGSQQEVGSSSNKFTYKLTSNTKADNYAISVEAGCLSVTRKGARAEITIAGADNTASYDGTNHKVNRAISTTFEYKGKTYTVTGLKETSDDAVNAGTYSTEITGAAVIKDENGKDVSDQFSIKGQNGTLTIKKAVVTLKSADLSKEVDGTALVNGQTALAIETGWANGEGATYTFTGKQKKVGISANSFNYKLKSNTNASNYEINKTEGTLNVKEKGDEPTPSEKIDLTITAKSLTETYTGNTYTIDGFEVKTEYESPYTVSGITAVGVSGTNAGTYTNKLVGKLKVVDGEGQDITNLFNIIAVNGTLKIKKAEVTLESASKTRQYNGYRLRNGDEPLKTNTGWADNEGIARYSFTGSQKLVGQSDNAFGYSLKSNTYADNYDITKKYGTLKVTDRESPFVVTVTSASAVKEYNKQEQTLEGFESIVFEDAVPNGFSVEGLTARVSRKNVGESTNAISGTATVLDDEGYDVTSQFKVVKVEGTLTITKKGTIGLEVGDDYEGEYDGNSHGVDVSVEETEETVISYSIDGGETWTTTPPTLKDVGSITVKVKAENPNYATEEDSYTITVKRKTVTVTTKPANKVFGNGDPKFTADVTGLLGSDTIEYSFTREPGDEVGRDYVLTATGAVNQGNYHVNYVASTFRVYKSSVNPEDPKEPDPNKPDDPVYDGITVDKIDDPLYDGESHKIDPVIRDKNGDVIDNDNFIITYPDDDYTNANEERRIVIKGKEGTGYGGEITIKFNIRKRNVTLTSASASKTYDGTALVKEEITVSGNGFIKGEGFIYKFSGAQTEVGSSENTFEYTVNETYTFTNPKNYNIKAVFGTLTVTAATGPIVVPDGPNDGPGRVIRAITGQQLEQLADAETPLANFFEDCCILHLILLFLALVMFIIYIVDNKKRKNRIYELEEELAKNGVMYW